ncbi:MAG: T9SS type A sorting domain-containing protein [Chitinophagaceae bacterium]
MKFYLLLVATISTSAAWAQWKGWGDLTAYPVQKNIHLLHTKDITGDGIPDITALPTAADEQFSILKGKGNGNFYAEKVLAKNTNYQLSDIADLDKDGYPELVISSYWDNGFRIYPGNAVNSFAQSTYYATGVHGRALKCVDINKDGFTDIVAVTSGSGRTIHLHVFINKGNGQFYEKKTFPSVLDTSKDIFIIDKNNDGLLDIAVSSSFAWVLFFMQTPSGDFEAKYWPTNTMAQVAFNDLDKDGKTDMLLLYTSFDNTPGSDSLVVKRNTGDTSFASSIVITQIAQHHIRPTFIKLADINRDGHADIFLNHCDEEGYSTDTLYYLLGTGNFTFGNPVPIRLPDTLLTLELADMNADNYPDLVVSTSNNTVYVALNNKAVPGNEPVTDIRIYPNPAHAHLYIDGLKNNSYTIRLYSSTGSLVFSKTSNTANTQIPLWQFASGIYFVHIITGDKREVVKQVVIK